MPTVLQITCGGTTRFLKRCRTLEPANSVVPAKAGTHNHRRQWCARPIHVIARSEATKQSRATRAVALDCFASLAMTNSSPALNDRPGLWVPAFAGTTERFLPQ